MNRGPQVKFYETAKSIEKELVKMTLPGRTSGSWNLTLFHIADTLTLPEKEGMLQENKTLKVTHGGGSRAAEMEHCFWETTAGSSAKTEIIFLLWDLGQIRRFLKSLWKLVWQKAKTFSFTMRICFLTSSLQFHGQDSSSRAQSQVTNTNWRYTAIKFLLF